MYALVKFYDGIYYVCKSNFITINKGITKVTYSDKRRYPASVIAKNGKLKYFICLTFLISLLLLLHILVNYFNYNNYKKGYKSALRV